MPKFGEESQAIVNHNAGHFGFSAIRIEDLEAQEYTLVTIVVDRSGSTSGFQTEMESCLKTIVDTCRDPRNPRADNLLLRVLSFDSQISELVGWEMLPSIDSARFDGVLNPGGSTALYDASINGIEGIQNFGKQLLAQDYQANGILFVITDGEENASKMVFNDVGNPGNDTAKYVRESLQQTIKGECVESLVSILIAVNAGSCARSLDRFHKEVGFTQFLDIQNANQKTLLKLAKFVSDSISSQSQALGSGGPSKTLPAPTF